jgi:flagellar basal body-associated protein FliL
MITLIFPSGLVEGDYPQPSEEHSKGKMSLTLIVMIPLIVVFLLSSAIFCLYMWRRKMAKRQGNCFTKCTLQSTICSISI